MIHRINTILSVFLLIVAGVLIFFTVKNYRKQAYVNVNKVFEEFAFKKKVEADLKKVQLARQAYLDSLKLQIQSALANPEDRVQNSRVEEMKKVYLLKEDQFIKEQEQTFQTYNEQIWKQLNQYVEDYGKEHQIDYLYGATGQGNLMYATEKDDVTKDIITYINAKYAGSNK
ncbi:MAG: OmpH family outer membrane protein [Sediminibacterium sp.]|nr:OmpH family outer membrane protein [Sediminibacterium sp.]